MWKVTTQNKQTKNTNQTDLKGPQIEAMWIKTVFLPCGPRAQLLLKNKQFIEGRSVLVVVRWRVVYDISRESRVISEHKSVSSKDPTQDPKTPHPRPLLPHFLVSLSRFFPYSLYFFTYSIKRERASLKPSTD